MLIDASHYDDIAENLDMRARNIGESRIWARRTAQGEARGKRRAISASSLSPRCSRAGSPPVLTTYI
jgi:hypothetical protein